MRKSVIIILCAALVLVGVYAAISFGGGDEHDHDDANTIKLTEIDTSTIMFLDYTLNGEAFSFTYTVYGWKLTGDEDFPVNQDILEDMVEALCAVTSERMLTDDRGTFSQYGLDPAALHVELTDSSGNVHAFNIGDKHPTTSKFYFNIEGSDEVYTVPTLVGRMYFNNPTLASLMTLPSMPTTGPSGTYSLTMERNGVKNEIVYLENGDPSCYSSDYKWFLKSGDGLRPMSMTKAEELISFFGSVGMQSGAAYGNNDETLAKYGFDEGYYTITLNYESASRGELTESFYIGQGDDGASYAMMEGSNVIGTLINLFDYFAFDYENYRPDELCLIPLDTVDSMTVLYGENRYVVKMNRGDDGTVDYTFNGSSISDDAFVSFYNTLYGVRAEQPVDTKPSSMPVLQFTFERNTETHKSMMLRFFDYDNNFYLSELNGEYMLINKRDVESILTSLNTALGLN